MGGGRHTKSELWSVKKKKKSSLLKLPGTLILHQVRTTRKSYRSLLTSRAIALALLLCLGVAAYATLGDGKKRQSSATRKLLSGRTLGFDGTLSLRSGYNFRGNTVLAPEQQRVIRLNTDVTMQVGKNTFTLPLRKNVFVDKVKIEFGNRSLRTP